MRLKLLIMLGLMIRIGFLKSTKNIYGYPLVRWRLGLEMEDGSDGLRGSRMADRLEMSTRPLVKIA